MIGAVAVAIAFIEILKAMALRGLYEAVLQQRDDQTRCHVTAAFVGGGAAVLRQLYRDCLHRMRNEAGLFTGVPLLPAGANNLDHIIRSMLTGGHPAIRAGNGGSIRALV